MRPNLLLRALYRFDRVNYVWDVLFEKGHEIVESEGAVLSVSVERDGNTTIIIFCGGVNLEKVLGCFGVNCVFATAVGCYGAALLLIELFDFAIRIFVENFEFAGNVIVADFSIEIKIAEVGGVGRE